MTDSMKFGPEWLRNMSSDNSGSGGGSGSNSSGPGGNALTLMPRFQQAEYRYGREEMLSLCEKDMKLPEILPNFKKLFVEKEQLPLALSPSTEDENVYQFASRPWPLRSPVSQAPPPRIGRGGSVDRGRGRPRILSSVSFPTRPPFEENTRAVGRGTDRGWPERNGGNDIGGSGDWNGSPSSSPRKEFNSHGRGSGMENWRRNRVEEDNGDGWRSSVSNSSGSSYRWSRSTSWRDEESTNPFLGNTGSGGGGTAGITPITRSFSSSASVGQSASSVPGNIERISNTLTSNGTIYKSHSQGNNSHDVGSTNNSIIPPMRDDSSSNSVNSTTTSQTSKANVMWDQEDIPEWAMENTTEGGGSFDASGAFHVPNDEEDDSVGSFERRTSQQSPEYVQDMHKANSEIGIKTSRQIDKTDQHQRADIGSKSSSAVQEGDPPVPPLIKQTSSSQLNVNIGDAGSSQSQSDTSVKLVSLEGITTHANQIIHTSPKPEETSPQLTAMQANKTAEPPSLSSISPPDIPVPKNTSSDLADRMQEVADDMVEKLIMEDEVSSSASPAGASGQMPLLKSAVTSSSPTGVPNHLLQHPLQVHNHPMMVPPPQPAPAPPSSELWYYRDPQNKIQGPFTGTEMAEWYRSDYFDENLFVRRVCDSRFATLGELVKMCGNSMPFLSSHLIPPLQNAPVLPLNNQPSGIVPSVPAPVNLSQSKPINVVNPILNTNEMATSLNMHLQYLQKEHLLRQSLIFSKLSASEQFALLSPERQQQIQQQMAQVSLSDNMVNLPASMNFLYGGGVNPSPFSMQQIIPGNSNNIGSQKPDLSQVKIPNSHNPFIASGGRAEFPVMPPLHNLMQSGNSGQPIIQAPTQQQPNATDEHIKAILRHLQTTKTLPPSVGNVYPPNPMPNIQRMPWISNSPNSSGPTSMWDFEPLNSNISMSMKPEMKTEQQILEEQRQHQQLQSKQQLHKSPTETQVNDQTIFSTKESSPPPKMPNHGLVSTTLPQPPDQSFTAPQQTSEPHVQQQQVQHSSKKPEEKKPKLTLLDDNIKNNKIEEVKKPTKTNKLEKKDSSKSQKTSEEDKKREAAEERKRQKEEKRKQQIEEDKKRQQQLQEDEKRRQMLEEKKRQEEIDRHRRAKMLENAPPKSLKQTSDSSNRSSVAPWSNTGLPGITTPAASLAEIQKAERERRTEERLELIHQQRKLQQIEMLTKVEPTLTWNAPPINVKSLAEIQAEEHKQQQQVAYDQAVATVVHRRKKDDLSISQQSFFTASNQNTAPNNVTATSSSLGSIWSSWNGKPAWSSTSNAGFWEEPAKIPSAASGASAQSKQANSGATHSGSNSNRLLSKSQTFSNIQTSGKNQNVATGSISGNEVRNTNSSSGTSSNKPSKGGTSTKQTKGSSSHSGGNGGQNVASNNKKDDARNEFISWCIKTLSTMKSTVDVPTFIQFLQDIESPYEVKDYIRIYLGETKECTEFGKQFLERRSKYKNQQRAQNAHIDDMCSPAPAINPASNDFQEVKGKGKKLKKSKMTKLDARILGFSVTAAQDRINVGDRDYGDAA